MESQDLGFTVHSWEFFISPLKCESICLYNRITDAHFPDIQAGIESALALAMTVMSGSHFILHGCGILGAYIAMSYEKFLADEELCGMVRRMLKEIEVSDQGIDLETIREVGIGGEYLTHPRTFERCRTEFFCRI